MGSWRPSVATLGHLSLTLVLGLCTAVARSPLSCLDAGPISRVKAKGITRLLPGASG